MKGEDGGLGGMAENRRTGEQEEKEDLTDLLVSVQGRPERGSLQKPLWGSCCCCSVRGQGGGLLGVREGSEHEHTGEGTGRSNQPASLLRVHLSSSKG